MCNNPRMSITDMCLDNSLSITQAFSVVDKFYSGNSNISDNEFLKAKDTIINLLNNEAKLLVLLSYEEIDGYITLINKKGNFALDYEIRLRNRFSSFRKRQITTWASINTDALGLNIEPRSFYVEDIIWASFLTKMFMILSDKIHKLEEDIKGDDSINEKRDFICMFKEALKSFRMQAIQMSACFEYLFLFFGDNIPVIAINDISLFFSCYFPKKVDFQPYYATFLSYLVHELFPFHNKDLNTEVAFDVPDNPNSVFNFMKVITGFEVIAPYLDDDFKNGLSHLLQGGAYICGVKHEADEISLELANIYRKKNK